MNDPVEPTPEVPALLTPTDAMPIAVDAPVASPPPESALAAPQSFVTRPADSTTYSQAETNALIDTARTAGWRDAMAQINAAVDAAREEAYGQGERDANQRYIEKFARSITLSFSPAVLLVLVHGVFRALASTPRVDGDKVAEIVGGITGAMVAAVPSVPYSRATMEPERTFAADVFKHTLVLPHDASTPSPAADIALRYAVAEMIMITLAYRPNVEYDADLAAKVAAIPPDVSAPAAAMHGAVKAFMETRQGHAAQ